MSNNVQYSQIDPEDGYEDDPEDDDLCANGFCCCVNRPMKPKSPARPGRWFDANLLSLYFRELKKPVVNLGW